MVSSWAGAICTNLKHCQSQEIEVAWPSGYSASHQFGTSREIAYTQDTRDSLVMT